MINQIYRIPETSEKDIVIEFQIIQTNDPDHGDIDKEEIQILIKSSNHEIYSFLEEDEIDSFIKFLKRSRKHIRYFNHNKLTQYKLDKQVVEHEEK